MIKREILPDILHWVGKEKILILKGARQVGKTTLLRQIIADIQAKDAGVQFTYIQAEENKYQQILQSPEAFEEYLKRTFGFPKKFLTVFVDEFQTIPNAGIFLKNIFDKYRERLQLIVSGSSS